MPCHTACPPPRPLRKPTKAQIFRNHYQIKSDEAINGAGVNISIPVKFSYETNLSGISAQAGQLIQKIKI
jgi:hypothetical protein